MKLQYFPDTDTLYIELRAVAVAETRDLDDDTLIDLDDNGSLCGLTIEHASERANVPDFSFEQITASDAERHPEIDAGLQEALDEVKAGRTFGPFHSAEDLIADLHRRTQAQKEPGTQQSTPDTTRTQR